MSLGTKKLILRVAEAFELWSQGKEKEKDQIFALGGRAAKFFKFQNPASGTCAPFVASHALEIQF